MREGSRRAKYNTAFERGNSVVKKKEGAGETEEIWGFRNAHCSAQKKRESLGDFLGMGEVGRGD